MDVVLGVAVTGRVARLAMVGSPASGGQVFDQYALDLPDDGLTDLADTIVGTYRAVADSGNRVAATRLCLPDASRAETLRQTVSSAGVPNVEVVSEAEAAAALARGAGADAALLLANDDTVSLTAVGEDEESTSVLASVPIGASGAAVACAAVLQQVPSAAVTKIMLVGQRLDLDSIAAELRSTAPVEVPPDPGYAIARGATETVEDSGFPAGAATQLAPAVADATQLAPAASDATQLGPAAADATQLAPARGDAAAVGPQLAYSQEEDPGYYEMPADSLEEFVPEQDDEAPYTAVIAPPPPRTVLMGSALAFVVLSFATLAVTVAITIRPAASVEAQPAPTVRSNTVPGRYLPPVPHEPDPVALPIAVVSPPPAAPAAPSVPTDRGPVNNNVPPAPQAPAPPAPQAPPAPEAPPGPAPVPQVPVVPIPPVIILPPLNPFPLPTFPTPTTTVTTPTTTTPATTTPTTTTAPTTTSEPTTTEQTTSSEPSTLPSSPSSVVTSTLEPESPASQPTAHIPPSVPADTPSAVATEPALTPPPAPVIEAPVPMIPEAPSSGGESSSAGGFSSGGESSSGGGDSGQVTTVPVSP